MNDNCRILLAEKSSFSQKGLQALGEIGPLVALDCSQAELPETVPDYAILVVRLGLRVDAAVIEAGCSLLAVGTPTTGLDHIDLAAAAARGIAVLSLKGERAFLEQVYATAEHTLALLLSLIRHVPAACAAVSRYEWRRDQLRGAELNGKTLGIVGLGRLGTMVARYALAFGMRVIAYDPYQPELLPSVGRCTQLEQLLEQSDVVSLHVPLNAETAGMISARQLACLRRSAVLINTARGALLDEAALLQALESGQLAGAALDVLGAEHQIENNIAHPLIEYACTHTNLLITPHIGGATQESVEKADLFLAEKINQYLSSRGLRNDYV